MDKDKKTLVIGASENPERYANIVTHRLLRKGYPVVPLGLKKGKIAGVEIMTGRPPLENIHTITLYMRASLQRPLYDYFFSLKPKRIIFNPGTENPELERMAKERNIEPVEACTLVMLSTGEY